MFVWRHGIILGGVLTETLLFFSNVVSMSAMFADATSFTGTKGSMARWNVEKVTRMDRVSD